MSAASDLLQAEAGFDRGGHPRIDFHDPETTINDLWDAAITVISDLLEERDNARRDQERQAAREECGVLHGLLKDAHALADDERDYRDRLDRMVAALLSCEESMPYLGKGPDGSYPPWEPHVAAKAADYLAAIDAHIAQREGKK